MPRGSRDTRSRLREIALRLGLSLNHGLQPLGEIILTFGLHRKTKCQSLGPNFFWCAQAPLVLLFLWQLIIALMVLLLFLWCYSSFGSGECHSYFMLLTLF
jgi:hypothetical protein